MREAVRALLPFALHALAREVDAALGVLLHTTLDVPDLVPQALGLLDPRDVVARVAGWTAAGAVIWLGLGALRARREGLGFRGALAAEAPAFGPLVLRPALTILALISVALTPAYPYAVTLPVALTQDWGVAQDVATAAALLALRLPPMRVPAPGAVAVFFLSFLVYALLTPERVRHWDGHPGNEPKYLRMAIALGHDLSLDVAAVSALPEGHPPMESLPARPLLASAVGALRTLGSESLRMLGALVPGAEGVGASAIRAKRLARQTVEGKEGGVFHVLSPGPSLLLAPTMRLDRAINLVRGTPGRMAVSVLAWNALAAALVAIVYLFLRDVTGRAGLSALVALPLALVPPFLFYFFQFYPEMPGALLLTWAIRALLFERRWCGGRLLGLGVVLAFLPWLHQKFLPVWGVLVVMAVLRAVDALVSLRALLALVVPQAVSLYLTALWNFAITGSARPDALFLAWGPAGITSARVHEGALGLLLDARYGLLPMVPVLLLAAGAAAGGPVVGRLALAVPAVLAYFLTVAAADNWSGAVCNLGRYAMPVVPFLVALVAVALGRVGGRRGVLAVTLALAGWTALLSLALWEDPRAANDSALLLGRSAFADPNVYVANLFFRSPLYLSPGHWARVLAWLCLTAVLGLWLRRVARGRGGESPGRALAALVVVVLAMGWILEGWRSPSRLPRFPNRIDVVPGVVAFPSGAAEVAGDHVRARGGAVELLVRSREPLGSLTVTAGGEGVVVVRGRPPLPLRAAGVAFDVPLETVATLTGRRGGRETLARQRLSLETPGAVSLRFAAVPPVAPFGENAPR